MTRFFLISMLSAACIAGPDVIAAEADAFVVQIPDPKQPFRIEDLTPEQTSLCAEFRRLAGGYRKPAFDALWQAGALPIDERRVSEAQVVALLGTPNRKEKDSMGYALGFDHGAGYSLAIMLVEGRAAMISFSKTL